MRRLQRPEFREPLARLPRERDLDPVLPAATPRTGGLARLLALTGAGLLLGGFLAFMPGVVRLGHADPGFPPLPVFGITLMVLAAPVFAAGGFAARQRGFADRLRWPVRR
jgi:hypothetical protein